MTNPNNTSANIHVLINLIQEDFCILAAKGKKLPELVSFAELDCVLDSLKTVYHPVQKANEPPLAKKALQFFFSGLTGYKFPVCHLPVIATNGEQLLHLTMKVVNALQIHGFQVPDFVIFLTGIHMNACMLGNNILQF